MAQAARGETIDFGKIKIHGISVLVTVFTKLGKLVCHNVVPQDLGTVCFSLDNDSVTNENFEGNEADDSWRRKTKESYLFDPNNNTPNWFYETNGFKITGPKLQKSFLDEASGVSKGQKKRIAQHKAQVEASLECEMFSLIPSMMNASGSRSSMDTELKETVEKAHVAVDEPLSLHQMKQKSKRRKTE
jgi:hypothetical protein